MADDHDISGTWEGTGTQNLPDQTIEFGFALALTQQNAAVSGTSTISILVNGQVVYVRLNLTGTFENDMLHFQELQIIETNQPLGLFGGGWCIKSGSLAYADSGSESLRGTWDGASMVNGGFCPGGAISLTKRS